MRSFILGGLLLTVCRIAAAESLSADDIMKRLEAQSAGIKDQKVQMEMVVQDVGHEPRHLGMQVHMRGSQRRVHFMYPGDAKGVSVLTMARGQTYVYLPQFRKVRRVAGHVKDQSMFGIDYNHEDADLNGMRDFYKFALASENDKVWTLKLTPKDGNETSYSAIEMDIGKDKDQLQELRYFGKDGAKVKTEERTDYVCEDNVCTARKTKVTNHAKDNHWTEVHIKEMKLNTNFSDQIFSLRDLQRSE